MTLGQANFPTEDDDISCYLDLPVLFVLPLGLLNFPNGWSVGESATMDSPNLLGMRNFSIALRPGSFKTELRKSS